MRKAVVRLSRGGQFSLPSEIRKRWNAEELVLEDRGNSAVLTPRPLDPIAAARGIWRSEGTATASEIKRTEREIETRREESRFGRFGKS